MDVPVRTATGADALTEAVIGGAIEVHRALGPGLLESAYESCLCHELASRGLGVRTQVPVPVRYKGVDVECGFRIDVLVENRLVVELKAVERIMPVHQAQLLTYLKLAGHKVGLIINFNEKLLKNGIQRFVK